MHVDFQFVEEKLKTLDSMCVEEGPCASGHSCGNFFLLDCNHKIANLSRLSDAERKLHSKSPTSALPKMIECLKLLLKSQNATEIHEGHKPDRQL